MNFDLFKQWGKSIKWWQIQDIYINIHVYCIYTLYICTCIRRDSDHHDNDYNQSLTDNDNTNEISCLLFVYMNDVFTTVFTVSKIAIFGILQSINQRVH